DSAFARRNPDSISGVASPWQRLAGFLFAPSQLPALRYISVSCPSLSRLPARTCPASLCLVSEIGSNIFGALDWLPHCQAGSPEPETTSLSLAAPASLNPSIERWATVRTETIRGRLGRPFSAPSRPHCRVRRGRKAPRCLHRASLGL